MEEHQKSEKTEQFKGSDGFEDINEDIDFKLSKGASSSLSQKPKSFDQSVILDKLSEDVLSEIAKSNLTHVYTRSEKQYQKDVNSGQSSKISNISELPNQSNVCRSQNKYPLTQSLPPINNNNINIDVDVLQSDTNNTNVRTEQYTRIFRLKKNANSEIIIDKFSQFIKQNGFETIDKNKQNVWVRKAFSKNIFKLIFHFCCGVNSNIADYQLILRDTTVQLKLTGETSKESQKTMKQMEIALWRSNQLELTEQDSLKFFIDSQQSDTLANQLKYIMETEEHQNGLELCLFSCFQNIDELTERFKLKCWDKPLSPQGKLTIEKQIYLSSKVFSHFKRHFQKQQSKYVSKKRQILNKMSISQCFDYLQVEPVYRLQFSVISSRIIPYWQAIRILERVNYYITPHQKLLCFNSYYQTIQQCCRTYHGGKILLQTMDHILPILIYTLLFAKCDYIYANIKMVELYVRQVSVCQPSLKMTANIFASIEYISNCWDFKHSV